MRAIRTQFANKEKVYISFTFQSDKNNCRIRTAKRIRTAFRAILLSCGGYIERVVPTGDVDAGVGTYFVLLVTDALKDAAEDDADLTFLWKLLVAEYVVDLDTVQIGPFEGSDIDRNFARKFYVHRVHDEASEWSDLDHIEDGSDAESLYEIEVIHLK